MICVASSRDGFPNASHHPGVHPFRSGPNRAAPVTDPDVSRLAGCACFADRRRAAARAERCLAYVHPAGSLELSRSVNHHERCLSLLRLHVSPRSCRAPSLRDSCVLALGGPLLVGLEHQVTDAVQHVRVADGAQQLEAALVAVDDQRAPRERDPAAVAVAPFPRVWTVRCGES
jgi:hypothetical protein